MEQTTQSTLRKWESSLTSYGKVDQWNIAEDYANLASFISSDYAYAARKAVKRCRDYAMAASHQTERLLSLVQNANNILNIESSRKKNESIGQTKRFKSATKKLYTERLKCMNGRCLKEIDIEIEDGPAARKVRRIVEKRMCQAYYHQNNGNRHNDGRDRHYTKRATSFQLHNLGQIECESGMCRTEATHWKKTYDKITGEVVYKKKMSYSTYNEAMEAARQLMLRKPNDKRPVSAYKCAYCDRWHIGHTSEYKKILPEMVTTLSQAS